MKIRIKLSRKNNIIQCTQVMIMATQKLAVVSNVYNHMILKHAKKYKSTPAKCVLYSSEHPANHKGCNVYRELTNARNGDNREINVRQIPQEQNSANT